MCVQRRLACSVGDSPTGVKVRDLVAWVAFVEETKRMKPTDKAIVRMVSESPGRNVSEPVGGLENALAPEAEPAFAGRRQHESSQADRSDETFRRGVRDSTVTRAGQATGEAVLVPPRNRWSRVGHITGATGKVADGETVAEGFVVCADRSNVRGAKEPCCQAVPMTVGEAGAPDKTSSSLQDPKSGGYTARGRRKRSEERGVGFG